MNITFARVAQPEQIADVARIAADIWREYYISILTAEQIDYMIGTFQSAPAITEQIKKRGDEYYLLQTTDSKQRIGYLSINVDHEKMFLSKLYIYRDYRGRGFANEAFAFLENVCKKRSLNKIWLTVNRHNEHSIAVYQKKGFQIVREQVADIGNGFVMDDFVMEKDLS